MKVILIEDLDRLGKAGDVVVVKEGYARNYLLPRKKAKPLTPESMKILEAIKKRRALEEKRRLEDVSALADKISKLSLTISEESGEEEKLYGSVTNEMISNALRQEGIDIDKREIILDEPIKKLGVYQVTVKLHPEVKASLRIWVIKK